MLISFKPFSFKSLSACSCDKPFVDEKGRKTKYIWFSSVDEEKGVSSKSPAHFVGNPCDENAVFVTEGALKADIASALSGRTFIAVAGTGCIDSLKEPFEIMKRNGITKVYECLDMDKTVNENVAKAAVKLTDMISGHGFKTKTTKWKWDKTKTSIFFFPKIVSNRFAKYLPLTPSSPPTPSYPTGSPASIKIE